MRLTHTNARSRQDGFTMMELMVVVVLVGSVLLLVPTNMMGFGALTRLDSAANTLVSALEGAKEQAILDGYDVFLELGFTKEGDEDYPAFRYRVTSQPAKVSESEDERTTVRATEEREWITTQWRRLPRGVLWGGFSERNGSWQKITAGGRTIEVHYLASGDVAGPVAIRLESDDLDVKDEFKFRTLMINALTSKPYWKTGKLELKESLDASQFNY
jgi:prepilin-type N-terminal cleavage/methylation domain-containing protein